MDAPLVAIPWEKSWLQGWAAVKSLSKATAGILAHREVQGQPSQPVQHRLIINTRSECGVLHFPPASVCQSLPPSFPQTGNSYHVPPECFSLINCFPFVPQLWVPVFLLSSMCVPAKLMQKRQSKSKMGWALVKTGCPPQSIGREVGRTAP